MPDMIGNITVPANDPSGTWPLPINFGTVRSFAPKVIVHQFDAANTKIEQRYYEGAGERRITLSYPRLSQSQLDALKAFWTARKGPTQPFTLVYPLEEGGPSSKTVRFADDTLTWQHLVGLNAGATISLVEVPTTLPTYSVSATLERFPNNTLATALLDQVQEIIPLIRIQPKVTPGSSYPAIYISNRRCTVGSQLYQARLLEWSGISQALGGESDDASFTLGNADGVIEALAADVDLQDAELAFSLFHVGTGIKLDLWKGEVSEYEPDGDGSRVVLHATDIGAALNELCPQRVIQRNCSKDFNDGSACPYASVGTAGFTSCDKSWANCQSRGMTNYFGGVFVQPQNVLTKDNASGAFGFNRRTYTASSQINDTIYGQVVPHVYTDSSIPVNCLIASGREEGDYYAALGIVSEGPLSAYDSDGLKHRLDGQPPHGPLPLGLRRSLGHDPVQNSDPDSNSQYFSLGAGNPQTYDVYKAAGIAFLDIRRTDPKGQQLSKVSEHAMVAQVSGGMGGWAWTDDTTRVWAQPLTNPVWIAVNEWLRTKRKFTASQAEQEAIFNVHEAVGAAAVCEATVDALVGAGTETQFRFRGTIKDQKPMKDQLNEILANCLGYYYMANGKLRIGIRYNASAVEAFTGGNMILDSLQLKRGGERRKFNSLTVQFADGDFGYVTNVVNIDDQAHRQKYGKLQAAQLNLLGSYTKSQSLRIGLVRLREGLGGINEGEWKKQRSVSFRTTILALAVEPGMVCSITHDRAPSGSIKFRVRRIRWNSDWSVQVDGDTVTNSMYDLTAGDKPSDVAVTPPPIESLNPVPGDVQAIGSDAFTVTVSDIADGNGVVRKALDVTYNPPADLYAWAGVSAYLQVSSGVPFPLGDADYNGDGSGSTPGRYGTARFSAPPPAGSSETWRLYLVSRSRSYRNRLKLYTDTAPSPFRTLTVAAGTPLVVPPAPPAENVSTVSATVFYNTDRWGLNVTVAFGSDRASIANAELIVRGPTNFGVSVDRVAYSFTPPASGSYSATIGGEWLRAGSTATFIVLVRVYNADGVPTDSPTASTSVSVQPLNSTTQASSASVTVWKDYTADGIEVYGFTLGWTQANDADTSHTEIWISAYDSTTSAYRKEQLYTQTVPGGSDNGYAISGRGNLIDAVPSSSQSFRVFFYTITTTGSRKPTAPYVDVTVSPGSGKIKMGRVDATTLAARLTVTGGQLDVADGSISSTKIGALAVLAGNLATGAVDTSKLQALAVTANELASSAVTAAKIASAAVGSAAIANAAVGNAAIANGAIDNAKIQDATIQSAKIASLAAEKINAGTITVGSGGMTFTGVGGIVIGGLGSVTVATGGVAATQAVLSASGYGWSVIGGFAGYIDYTSGMSNAYINAGSFRVGSSVVFDAARNVYPSSVVVGGTTVIDSSRNGAFNNLRVNGQLSGSYETSSAGSTSAGRIPFYNSFGFLVGYIPLLF